MNIKSTLKFFNVEMRVRKHKLCLECVWVYTDHSHKASRYSSELTYWKTRITTSPKHMIGLKTKRELKHKNKGKT